MLYKQGVRAYAPMTHNEVVWIHEAGRRVKALDIIIKRSLQTNQRTTALLAQKEAEELRRVAYQNYDIRL